MRANIRGVVPRPRLLSVSEAAAELKASEAYVRRLLLRRRLYGIKVGTVWAVLPEDLEAFKRIRRAPGRPRKVVTTAPGRS
jgi:excisionase family DNA binding protein